MSKLITTVILVDLKVIGGFKLFVYFSFLSFKTKLYFA